MRRHRRQEQLDREAKAWSCYQVIPYLLRLPSSKWPRDERSVPPADCRPYMGTISNQQVRSISTSICQTEFLRITCPAPGVTGHVISSGRTGRN